MGGEGGYIWNYHFLIHTRKTVVRFDKEDQNANR